MKHLITLLLLPLLAFGQNLIVNGSFENGLESWKTISGIPMPDIQNCAVGMKSLKLASADRTAVQQIVTLQDDVIYEIICKVKGEAIQGGENNGARIMLEGDKSWKRVSSNTDNSCETGTFDWRTAKLRFSTKDLKSTTVKVMPILIGTGTVWYDDIRITAVEVATPDSKKNFRDNFGEAVSDGCLYPEGGILGFFEPGDDVRMTLELEGTSPVDIDFVVKDYEGKVFYEEKRTGVQLPCKEALLLGQDLPRNYYIATATVFAKKQKSFAVQGGFAVNEAPAKRDPYYSFGYGVDPQFLEAFKRIGCGNISHKLFYGTYYKRNAEFLLDYNLRQIQPFLNGDFTVDVHVHTAPPKAMHNNDEQVADGWMVVNDDMQAKISKLVTLFAEATKGKVDTWSTGQEIPSTAIMKHKYCGTWSEAMAQHVCLTRLVKRALDKVDPDMPFWTGGCNQQSNLEPYERLVLEDLKDDFDGYLLDGYTGNWNLMLNNAMRPEDSLKSFLMQASEMAVKLGKNPLVRNNETGYAINYGAPFDEGMAVEQAFLTLRTIAINRACPTLSFELHVPTKTYNVNNLKNSDMCMTTVWKPVEHNGSIYQIPLPGGAMYATAARELAFVKCTDEIIRENFYGYVFRREDGKTVAIVWNRAKDAEVSFGLEQPATRITMLGREEPYQPGALSIISQQPFYLVSGESTDAVAQAIRDAFRKAIPDCQVAALRERGNQLAIYATSNDSQIRQAEIQVEGRDPIAITLEPDKVNTLLIPYTEKASLVIGQKSYDIEDEAPKAAQVPRIAATPIFNGSGEWLKNIPAVMLEYPDAIFPKSALQPEKAYFKTSYSPDAHSISAQCFLAYDDDNLYLAAKVDDPKHCQHFDDAEIWRGDCLQFVLTDRCIPPAGLAGTTLNASDRTGTLNFAVALKGDRVVYRRLLGMNAACNYPANVTRQGDCTFYEIAIPWKELGFRPVEDTSIRLGFVIMDNNDMTAQLAPYWLAFSEGVAGGQDIAKFRLLEFK
ncbi:MAG: hypothetical protein MJ202_01855 [Lentisphaeria bacterium]|nr:hypothetical protein [Lentisphaeria bacterium]